MEHPFQLLKNSILYFFNNKQLLKIATFFTSLLAVFFGIGTALKLYQEVSGCTHLVDPSLFVIVQIITVFFSFVAPFVFTDLILLDLRKDVQPLWSRLGRACFNIFRFVFSLIILIAPFIGLVNSFFTGMSSVGYFLVICLLDMFLFFFWPLFIDSKSFSLRFISYNWHALKNNFLYLLGFIVLYETVNLCVNFVIASTFDEIVSFITHQYFPLSFLLTALSIVLSVKFFCLTWFTCASMCILNASQARTYLQLGGPKQLRD